MSGAPGSALGEGAEFDLIRQLLAARGGTGVQTLVDAGDDCAVLDAGRIAISSDLSIEGVHFERAWLEPEEIGYRAAAAALSDLAAMAAAPLAVLVSVGAPSHLAAEIPLVMRGVHSLVEAHGARVIGGDLSRSPVLLLDVTVLGSVEMPVQRSGAQPGDGLWVTGALGGAAAAVAAWKRGEVPVAGARTAFARPQPRIAESMWLAERGIPRAMLDVSDGVAGDARHLAAAGALALRVFTQSLPLHSAARAAAADAVQLALTGGEDYELLFAAKDDAIASVKDEFTRRFDLPLTRVGVFAAGAGVTIESAEDDAAPLDFHGYRHFEEL